MTQNEKLQIVHASLVNGQRGQMTDQINLYFPMSNFWEEYFDFLEEIYDKDDLVMSYFMDAAISYHQITYRRKL